MLRFVITWYMYIPVLIVDIVTWFCSFSLVVLRLGAEKPSTCTIKMLKGCNIFYQILETMTGTPRPWYSVSFTWLSYELDGSNLCQLRIKSFIVKTFYQIVTRYFFFVGQDSHIMYLSIRLGFDNNILSIPISYKVTNKSFSSSF